MSKKNKIDLTRADHWFGVANTPLFLLRRLQSDAGVREMADQVSGRALLSSLKKALKGNPKTLRAAARPYAYVAALGLKADPRYLRAASLLEAPHHDWYAYIAGVLVEGRAAAASTAEVRADAMQNASSTRQLAAASNTSSRLVKAQT